MTSISMRNVWHPIATLDEVTEQPKQFVLLGERVVAFRDETGPVAFKDLCIHRGSALSRGSVRDGRLACPYHGWQYDRTGACVHIPSLPEGATIPRKAHAIVFRARIDYGLVWVAMDEPVQPFPSWPDEAWTNSDYRVFLVNQYLWKTSAERFIENVMDFSHFNFVHKGYTELADGPVIKPYDLTKSATGIEFTYDDGRLRREYSLHFPYVLHDKKSVIAQGRGGTWSEGEESRAGDATILSFIASPVDESTTRIYAFIARNHSRDKDDSAFSDGFDTIMEQDRVIVESQRPEQIPTDLREELHLKISDAAAIAYRRMLGELEGAQTSTP